MPRIWVWSGLLLLACGGSAKNTSPAGSTGGTSHSAGSESGGAAGVRDQTPGGAGSATGGSGVAGNDAAGTGDSGGVAGSSGQAGAANGRGGVGGTGGKVPDPVGGSDGADPLSCGTPYTGPNSGPRADGPVDLGSCASIPDSVILARYDDAPARVPQGSYYEPNDGLVSWDKPCSLSPAETNQRGADAALGSYIDSYSNEWFYEAVYCKDGLRRIERNLRCDYFDGSKLSNPSPERLAFLASMLWWGQYHNLGGAVILGHSIVIGDATDIVELCTLNTSYGDFGLCDEVRLQSTKYRLIVGGSVEVDAPQLIRTVKGQCR